MFVRPGPFHPTMQATVCTIRRVHNKTVWYLKEKIAGRAIWTQRYMEAYRFNSEEEAVDLIETNLKHCKDQCDIFKQDDMWMI